MIAVVVIMTIVILATGYWTYGRYLARRLDLQNTHPTPACTRTDGIDYVPAPAFLLLGHHFSGVVGIILLVLSLWLLAEAIRTLRSNQPAPRKATP